MPPTSLTALLGPDRRNITLDKAVVASRLLGYEVLCRNITNSLAAFAVLVILRFIFTKVLAWRVRAPGLQKDQLSRHSLLVKQQRLHHQFAQGRSWTMDEKSRGVSSSSSGADSSALDLRPTRPAQLLDGHNPESNKAMVGHSESVVYGSGIAAELAKGRHLVARPPPPPPLTPPELSTAVFTFENRRRSYAASAHELDSSFFDQPNPDYMTSTSSAVSPHDETSPTSPSLAKRRSYNKTLPLGIAPPTASAAPDVADSVFSPSSFPPTSPLLPPPPPGHHGSSVESDSPHDVDLQGEIISVMDDHGAGWKRHTRVYGGGVCLACAASGNAEGGFYGDNVRPEEMRH